MPNDKVLVTGAAGFIGFHVARQLLANDREVVGAFRPSTTIDEGVARFAKWYREYHRL
jgi:nucleoside-diphosphate-sugar epimerase